MNKHFTSLLVLVLSCYCLFSFQASAQTVISGTITDSDSEEALIGVNILVKGTVTGTITDINGNFRLSVSQTPPITLAFSIVGYASQELEISSNEVNDLAISLEEQTIFGQEIVVSASRFEESILESPVSIEKMDIIAVRETPAANFYDALANLKGVDVSTNSITFRSINTRGFGANGNERFVQLIDGIDNQAPGLNFAVGNVVGLSELDLESLELIAGASSALYGPNALNGILLMNSKNPFQYQGLSAYVRNGVNTINKLDGTGMEEETEYSFYQDYGIRYAKAFNDKWAFKVNATYLRAEQDFNAIDFRDQNTNNGFGFEDGRPEGTRETNPGFNGINIYGDDGAIPLSLVYTNPLYVNQALIPLAAATGTSTGYLQSIIPNSSVSRTGWQEEELVDYTAESLKFNGALHYRFTEEIEGSLSAFVGTGSSVYTANNRFFLDNFSLGQYKAEVKGSNFFARAYTTRENSGDTYSTAFMALLLNETASPSQQEWFINYTTGYLVNALPSVLGVAGIPVNPDDPNLQEVWHNAARAFADGQTGDLSLLGNPVIAEPGPWLDPNSSNPAVVDKYYRSIDSLRQISLPNGGALLVDETSMWHAEAMYDFNKQIQTFELIVGGNFRRYNLKSDGNLFAFDDNGDEFSINEFGGYLQISDRFLDESLKLSGSVRYDKNENFKGQFTPRITAVYTIAGLHNIRASYQTGFRIPTTQDQFIDLDVVTQRLVGSNDILKSRFNMFPNQNPVYSPEVAAAAQAVFQTGDTTAAQAMLTPFEFREFDTEKVQTFELGYKSLIDNRLMIDIYGYYSTYEDFIGLQRLVQGQVDPATRPSDPVLASAGSGDPVQDQLNLLAGSTQNYGVDINIDADVNSYGFGAGANYAFPRRYALSGNVTFNRLDNPETISEQGFAAAYNTPEWRTNLTFSNREVIENLGFSISWRYQEAFLWESSFGSGFIPEYHSIDAQVSYKVPSIKSILKLGGSNLLNERFVSSFGNPTQGAIYYLQITFDEFLN